FSQKKRWNCRKFMQINENPPVDKPVKLVCGRFFFGNNYIYCDNTIAGQGEGKYVGTHFQKSMVCRGRLWITPPWRYLYDDPNQARNYCTVRLFEGGAVPVCCGADHLL